MVDDARIGFTFRGHCTSRGKTAEGPWTTYQYNSCGYRSNAPCGPKPAGAARISLIGSSVALGVFVPYEQTLAGLTETKLSELYKKPVEIQNLGRPDCSVGCMFHRFDEAMALKPDILVLTVSPHDIFITTPADVADRYEPVPPSHGPKVADKQNHSLLRRLRISVNTSFTAIAAEHFLFQDSDNYLSLYMNYGDQADYLRKPLSPAWNERLANAELLLGEMADKAHAAGVPVVLEEMPDEPQVAMLLTKKKFPNADPLVFNQRLAAIAHRHGIALADPLDEFRGTPSPSRDFYVVNGHLNGQGYTYISAALLKAISRLKNNALDSCSAPVGSITSHGM